MRNPHSKYPIVYVEWDDATANADWFDAEELREWCLDYHKLKIHHIGWLIKKDSRCIVLASRYSEDTASFGELQMIPATWCKVTILAPPKKKC